MNVPYWFQHELKLIDPLYFAAYNERTRTVSIRKWTSMYPRPRTWKIDSKQICRVHYDNLDRRILNELREGLYWAKHAKELIQQLDRSNDRIDEQADDELEYVSRFMAKDIYRHYKEPRVIGGVSGTDRPWKY